MGNILNIDSNTFWVKTKPLKWSESKKKVKKSHFSRKFHRGTHREICEKNAFFGVSLQFQMALKNFLCVKPPWYGYSKYPPNDALSEKISFMFIGHTHRKILAKNKILAPEKKLSPASTVEELHKNSMLYPTFKIQFWQSEKEIWAICDYEYRMWRL